MVEIGTKDQIAILGGVTWLCQHAQLQQSYPVGMFLSRIIVSIELNQFRYFENEHGVPVAFCNWAYLSSDLLEQALSGELDFKPDHWQSGPHFFIPELIAPFGHCRYVARDLRTHIGKKNQKAWPFVANSWGRANRLRPVSTGLPMSDRLQFG